MSKLSVNTIAHTGGTTAMTVDSTGRILTPARPAFRAFIPSNLPSTDYTTGGTHQITFPSESYDIGGNYDTGNGKFIVPITGLYHFHVNFYVSGITAATYTSAYLFVGTDEVSRGIHDPSSTGNYAISVVTDVLQLTAGDEVTAHFSVGTDNSVIIHGQTNGAISYFSGHLIG